MSLDALSRVLWREREILETLLFKLEEERLVVTAGLTRWLPYATTEVENVLAKIRELELGRAMEAENAAESLGLPPTAPLSDISKAASEPWQSLLNQHREALLSLTTEISQVSQFNREQLNSLQRATRETLLALQDSVGTYDPTGTATAESTTAHMLDQSV